MVFNISQSIIIFKTINKNCKSSLKRDIIEKGCCHKSPKRTPIEYSSSSKFISPGACIVLEKHLNPSGKGIPKFLKGTGKQPALIDIIEGRTNAASFSPEKIKYRLVSEGHLKEECNCCGFNERRVLDYKIPLLLHFKDKNKKNYRKENIEFLCYNCFYLTIGDVFDNKQIEGIEDHKPVNSSEVDWEVDDYTAQRLKELGLGDDEDDGLDIVSYV